MSQGKKRYPVIFEKRTVTKNSIGDSVESWATEFRTYCDIERGTVDTVNDDDANLVVSDLKITVTKTSKTKALTAAHYRAIIDSKAYKIVDIDPFSVMREIKFFISNYD